MSIAAETYSTPIGTWAGDSSRLIQDTESWSTVLNDLQNPLCVVATDQGPALGSIEGVTLGPEGEGMPVLGIVPACSPQHLGDTSFCQDHGIQVPYVAGAMANAIASVELVEAMSHGGMIGFYGAAGRPLDQVRDSVEQLTSSLGDAPFGINLIHSPNESDVEQGIADLLLEKGVHVIEASAFLKLTLPIIQFRVKGIYRDEKGNVVTPNKIIAKVSREELAERFFSPPPGKLLAKLLEQGTITAEEAELAKEIPVAQDLTAEADSGGHTDNRPALAMLPTFLRLRDRLQEQFGFSQPLRVGLGGGVSTPESATAAFAMGAAYIVTGSVNQACQESGTSEMVREMLAETRQADVAKAPAADMFEMGVNVQVLKRGTMFSMRGGKLYEAYRAYNSIDEIPAEEREKMEKQFFRAPLEQVWKDTEAFFKVRDPRQIERAKENPKHKMALIFRSYLGQSSNWANSGVEDRKMDFQVWCGPAMGAFNEWVRGSFLENTTARKVEVVAKNILYGAAVLHRVNVIRRLGIAVPATVSNIRPKELSELDPYFS
jgi:PfaD family protein